jgi:predicted TIM-barrel fold metal-dependent hydrolase
VKRVALILTTILAGLVFLAPYARAADADSAAERQRLLAGYAAEISRIRATGVIPVIDVEHHWGAKMPIEALIAKMDKAGVALTWLGQNERNGSAHVFPDAARFPTRIVPTTIHGDGKRWHGRDLTLLDELAADTASGRYFAMGEFEARHYVSSTNDRDVHLPVDSESFERVFRIAEATGLPMLLHHEAEDRLLPELERMLARHPKAVVIWCHVGRNRDANTWTVLPRPDGVRDFIRRFPNLYFDLNQSPPGGRHKGTRQLDSVLYDRVNPDKGGDNQPDAVLSDEWRVLFEEHPERFLFGSDVNTGRWDNYERVAENFRWLVLKRLSRGAAEKIAWRNAWRLMGGGEIGD